jgi:hypothetical protein
MVTTWLKLNSVLFDLVWNDPCLNMVTVQKLQIQLYCNLVTVLMHIILYFGPNFSVVVPKV